MTKSLALLHHIRIVWSLQVPTILCLLVSVDPGRAQEGVKVEPFSPAQREEAVAQMRREGQLQNITLETISRWQLSPPIEFVATPFVLPAAVISAVAAPLFALKPYSGLCLPLDNAFSYRLRCPTFVDITAVAGAGSRRATCACQGLRRSRR